MKKIAYLLTVAATLALMSFAVIDTKNTPADSTADSGVKAALPTVTAYQIKQVAARAWSSRAVQAEFDKPNMTLYVMEKRGGKEIKQPYSVRTNPYKGYDDDDRGPYEYCAADYYFNF